jgi:signal transduction histidine kinase
MANSHAFSLDCERPPGWLPRALQRPPASGPEPLTALRTKLAALVRASTSERLPSGHWVVICPEDLLGHLAEATSHVDKVLQELRRNRASRSAEAAGQRLFDRVRALCVRFAGETEIRCECSVSLEHVRFNDNVADAVYWTIAELLTNVRKHSRATTVMISSGAEVGGYVFLRVQDDGVGLAQPYAPAPPCDSRGLGLWSIEHRLNELDASVEIASVDGFTVTIKLPPWSVARADAPAGCR